MKKEKITGRSTAYLFPDLGMDTFVYSIKTAQRVWIIDTFCGTESMEPLLADLPAEREQKVIVVNTHFHWDHVWGNCAFDGEVISHWRCRTRLEENWERDLEKHGEYRRGNTEKRLPTVTFAERLAFPDEGIELFYSPGHTADSISLFDHEDGILYVGDNLEKPLIYVEDPDLDTYLKTLAEYKKYRPLWLMAGHSSRLTLSEVDQTIHYLRQLQAGDKVVLATEEERLIHAQNSKVLKGEMV